MIRLSIITPVFNNVTYIGHAIENYLSIASEKTELIIIDGGSTDGTVDVINSYLTKKTSILLISEKDNGQSDAMNKGIKLAKGDFISFLNVDDYYSKDTFNQILTLIESDSSLKFIVGDCNVWNDKSELIYINRPSKLKLWHILSGYHFPVNPTAYFYKKEIHEMTSYYNVDNHYSMDLEFLIEARMEVEFVYFPIVWGNFRVLPETKTSVDNQNNLLENRKRELLKRYFRQQNLYIKLRVILYTFKRSNSPIMNKFIRKVIDKLKYEWNKVFRS